MVWEEKEAKVRTLANNQLHISSSLSHWVIPEHYLEPGSVLNAGASDMVQTFKAHSLVGLRGNKYINQYETM
jgi:hypothetical protein